LATFQVLTRGLGGTRGAHGRLARSQAARPLLRRGAPTHAPLTGAARCVDELGHEVDALAADDPRPHQVADRQPRAQPDQRGGAVDLGGLPGAAALGAAAVDALDQHLDDLADPVLGPLRRQLLDQHLEAVHPLVDDVLRQVVRQRLRLGPVLVGVPEHPDGVEAGGQQEALQLVDVVVGLAREADDDVAAHGRRRVAGADLVQQGEEAVGVAEAAHPPQHRAARVLEAHVEVRRDAGGAGEDLDQPGPQLGGLQVAEPHPRQAVERRQLGQQRLEQPQVAEVLAVAGAVLADQHQLAHAVLGEPAGLGHHVRRAAADEAAAEARDGAERAAAVGSRWRA
jgi:hypothetical protein